MIEAKELTKEFGDQTAVDGVSLSVGAGEVVGLVGANGAGKTTFIRMLLGLLRPTSGSIEVLGLAPGDVDRAQVGYVAQGLGLYRDLTVAQNVAFVAASFGVEPPELEPDLQRVAGQPVGSISLGLQRRLAFSTMLSHSPRLLILDEPTSGVGPLGRISLWNSIRNEAEGGAGVLVTTHYMDEAEQCDRVVMLARGRQVAAGTANEIIAGRQSVSISGLGQSGLQSLGEAGLTTIPQGAEWRVPGADLTRVRQLVGDGVELSRVPMSFEEAFLDLSA